eukprot:3092582-Pleurochrysis_carterae.AAC.1
MKLVNNLLCDKVKLEVKDIVMSWEEMESFEYGRNEFGEPVKKKNFVKVEGNAHNMMQRMK